MLFVEIAKDKKSQEEGLMNRKHLDDNCGMLFKFPKKDILRFWGMNTYIPLDIAFINNNQIIKIDKIKELNLDSVTSENPCDMAIEANLDYFKKNNIKIGDIIELKEDYIDGSYIVFKKAKKFKKAQVTEEITEYDIEDDMEDEYNIDIDPNEYNAYTENINIQEEESTKNLPIVTEENLNLQDDLQDPDAFENYPENLDIDVERHQDEEPEGPKQDYPSFSSIEEALKWADFNNEVIWIDYITKSGINIRNVEPHGIYMANTGNNLLVTFDENVNDIRSFIIKKIKDFKFLGRRFNDKFIFSPK